MPLTWNTAWFDKWASPSETTADACRPLLSFFPRLPVLDSSTCFLLSCSFFICCSSHLIKHTERSTQLYWSATWYFFTYVILPYIREGKTGSSFLTQCTQKERLSLSRHWSRSSICKLMSIDINAPQTFMNFRFFQKGAENVQEKPPWHFCWNIFKSFSNRFMPLSLWCLIHLLKTADLHVSALYSTSSVTSEEQVILLLCSDVYCMVHFTSFQVWKQTKPDEGGSGRVICIWNYSIRVDWLGAKWGMGYDWTEDD